MLLLVSTVSTYSTDGGVLCKHYVLIVVSGMVQPGYPIPCFTAALYNGGYLTGGGYYEYSVPCIEYVQPCSSIIHTASTASCITVSTSAPYTLMDARTSGSVYHLLPTYGMTL